MRSRHHAGLLALALWSAGLAQAQNLAFSVDADGTDQLWALSLETGDAIPLGPTGFAHIGALTFAPDGRLLGVDEHSRTLLHLDLASGAGSVIGRLDTPALTGAGLTFDQSGKLWLSDQQSGTLYRIDPRSARILEREQSEEPITALTFLGRETLALGTDRRALLRWSASVRTREAVGSLGLQNLAAGAGIDAALTGELHVVTGDGNLYRVDPASGRAIHVATTRAGLQSLAIPRQGRCALGIDPDLSDELFDMDVVTGSLINHGITGFDAITGLTRTPSGTLYAIDTIADVLLEIQTSPLRVRTVGPLRVPVTNTGLALDERGTLWMLSTDRKLYTVNQTTGRATLVTERGPSVDSLTARGSYLYGVGDDHLQRIDVRTLVPEVIGPLLHVSANNTGLSFDADGTLWGCSDGRDLFLVSELTGAAIPVARTLVGIEALAMMPCSVTPARFLAHTARLESRTSGSPLRNVFDLRGTISTAGIAEDLFGVIVLLWIDGQAMPIAPILDSRGRSSFRSREENMRFKLDRVTGEFAFRARGLDLSNILTPGLIGRAEQWMDVRLAIVGAGLEQQTMHTRLPFTTKTRASRTMASYRFGERKPLGGVFSVTDMEGREHGVGHAFDVRGFIAPSGPHDLHLEEGHAGHTAITVKIGEDTEHAVSFSEITRLGNDTYLYRALHAGQAIQSFKLDAKRGRFEFETGALEHTGLPEPALAQTHTLEVRAHLATIAGEELFRARVPLTYAERKGAWVRQR